MYFYPFLTLNLYIYISMFFRTESQSIAVELCNTEEPKKIHDADTACPRDTPETKDHSKNSKETNHNDPL